MSRRSAARPSPSASTTARKRTGSLRFSNTRRTPLAGGRRQPPCFRNMGCRSAVSTRREDWTSHGAQGSTRIGRSGAAQRCVAGRCGSFRGDVRLVVRGARGAGKGGERRRCRVAAGARTARVAMPVRHECSRAGHGFRRAVALINAALRAAERGGGAGERESGATSVRNFRGFASVGARIGCGRGAVVRDRWRVP